MQYLSPFFVTEEGRPAPFRWRDRNTNIILLLYCAHDLFDMALILFRRDLFFQCPMYRVGVAAGKSTDTEGTFRWLERMKRAGFTFVLTVDKAARHVSRQPVWVIVTIVNSGK